MDGSGQWRTARPSVVSGGDDGRPRPRTMSGPQHHPSTVESQHLTRSKLLPLHHLHQSSGELLGPSPRTPSSTRPSPHLPIRREKPNPKQARADLAPFRPVSPLCTLRRPRGRSGGARGRNRQVGKKQVGYHGVAVISHPPSAERRREEDKCPLHTVGSRPDSQGRICRYLPLSSRPVLALEADSMS